LATLETAMGLFVQARKTVADGLKKSPKEPQLLDALIKVGIAGQDYAQAAMDAWAAICSCPTGGQGKWHLFLARFLAGGSDKQRAKAVVSLGLEVFPENEELKELDKKM
jgi:hypothetical protein